MRKFSDPYSTIARFPSRCSMTSCQSRIKKGDPIVYDKMRGLVYCVHCGASVLDGVRAERSMEQYGTDIF